MQAGSSTPHSVAMSTIHKGLGDICDHSIVRPRQMSSQTTTPIRRWSLPLYVNGLFNKGRRTVVLNQTDYREKVTVLLSNIPTYEPLKKDPVCSSKQKVMDGLKQLEQDDAMDRSLYYRLYPGEATPGLYASPKTQSQEGPMRLIVCMINCHLRHFHVSGLCSQPVGRQ